MLVLNILKEIAPFAEVGRGKTGSGLRFYLNVLTRSPPLLTGFSEDKILESNLGLITSSPTSNYITNYSCRIKPQ